MTPPASCLRRLLRDFERHHRQRAVQYLQAPLRGGDRGAGTRRVVVIALHRLSQLLVGELHARDELEAILAATGNTLHGVLLLDAPAKSFPAPTPNPWMQASGQFFSACNLLIWLV